MLNNDTRPRTVLVIDDDPAIRHVLTFMLTRIGFATLEAPDGETGAAVFRRESKEIVAVLLDVMMLGMSSADTVKEIQSVNKDVRILLCTGASDTMVEAVFPDGMPGASIHKPFQQQELAAALGDLLPTDTAKQ
jgi:DNA-binding response OmpR family regulator